MKLLSAFPHLAARTWLPFPATLRIAWPPPIRLAHPAIHRSVNVERFAVARQGLDSKRTGALYPRPEGRGFTARGDKVTEDGDAPIVLDGTGNRSLGWSAG